MSTLAPIRTLDPDAAHREWLRRFETHLDYVPPLLNTMSVLAIPSLRTQKYGFESERVSGGGYVDNIPLVDAGSSAEAALIWGMLVEYCRAVHDWLQCDLPLIAYDDRTWAGTPIPDPNPRVAADRALETIGWLIGHADRIEPIHELDAYREGFFATIRRARGVFKAAATRYRGTEGFCGVCGTNGVVVDWLNTPAGTVRAEVCRQCGQTDIQEDDDAR